MEYFSTLDMVRVLEAFERAFMGRRIVDPEVCKAVERLANTMLQTLDPKPKGEV